MKSNFKERAQELVLHCHAGNQAHHVGIIHYALAEVERETLERAATIVIEACGYRTVDKRQAEIFAEEIRSLSSQDGDK